MNANVHSALHMILGAGSSIMCDILFVSVYRSLWSRRHLSFIWNI